MAPTFIVEDGSGLANANSYSSEAEADQYHENHGDPAAWSGALQADKEDALRSASFFLDNKYGSRWRGRRENDYVENGLDWPRVNVIDDDGFTIDSNVVPKRVKQATAILALNVINGDTLTPDQSNPGTIKRRRRKVGPIETEDEYTGGRSQTKWYREVDQLMRPLVFDTQQMARS